MSDIENGRNDDDVTVTIFYSADPMRCDGSSNIVLPDFTFRVNDNPDLTGLSAAYEIEGPPAFIPPEQHLQLAAGGAVKGVPAR